MRCCTLCLVSFVVPLLLVVAGSAHASHDGGTPSTCDGGDSAVCSPSDGGLVDDGGTCRAVGGRCVSLDAGSECGELLSGLPCTSETMCCMIASANADGSAVFDGAVCTAIGSACTPGNSCCEGASCAEYGADGAFVCGYPSLDAGAPTGARDATACSTCGSHPEAGASAGAPSASGGCSSSASAPAVAGTSVLGAYGVLGTALFVLANRRRRGRARSATKISARVV